MNQEWFSPIIFSFGRFEVRWYGLMYVIGFMLGGMILKHLADKKFWPIPKDTVDSYVTWLIVGMFLGARLFYVFLYNWEYYSVNLGDAFAVWKGGLSFHGAVVGMCTATWLFAKKFNLHFFQLGDSMAVAGTQGLFFGRMGNFINGELYGRVTDSWAGMVFPGGGEFPRHPSQLYEGISEGIILSIIIWFVHKKQKFYGVCSAVFCVGYGVFRFVVEFFREPDAQLGYYLGIFTMGQMLCFAMIIVGVFVLLYAKKLNIKNPLVQS